MPNPPSRIPPPPPPSRTPASTPARSAAPSVTAPSSSTLAQKPEGVSKSFDPAAILRSEDGDRIPRAPDHLIEAAFDDLIQDRPSAPRMGILSGPEKQLASISDALNALTHQRPASPSFLDPERSRRFAGLSDALEALHGGSEIDNYYKTLIRPLGIDPTLEKVAWQEIRNWALAIERIDEACHALSDIHTAFQRRNLLNPTGGKLLLAALCEEDVQSLAALRDRLIPEASDSELHAAMVDNNYGNPGSNWSRPSIRLEEISAAYERIAEVDPELAEQLSLKNWRNVDKKELQRFFLKLGLELSQTNAAQALKTKNEAEAEAMRRRYAIQKDVLLIWNCYFQAGLV